MVSRLDRVACGVAPGLVKLPAIEHSIAGFVLVRIGRRHHKRLGLGKTFLLHELSPIVHLDRYVHLVNVQRPQTGRIDLYKESSLAAIDIDPVEIKDRPLDVNRQFHFCPKR